MRERESWEKELEALGRDSAAEGAQPVEIAAGETETGAELWPPLSAWWCF